MKSRYYIALLVMILALSLLAGCSARALDTGLDRAEDAVEKAIRDAVTPSGSPQTGTLLTPEEALQTALSHAGFTADQVRHLHTEYETDDRVPHYDVSFREGPWEYEYEIHAATGEILSFEKDD